MTLVNPQAEKPCFKNYHKKSGYFQAPEYLALWSQPPPKMLSFSLLLVTLRTPGAYKGNQQDSHEVLSKGQNQHHVVISGLLSEKTTVM